MSVTTARTSWTFEAIGTAWTIETEEPLSATTRDAVAAIISRFDADWSRFRDDSLVSRLAAGGAVAAPPDAAAMFELYAELDVATAGAVNPLVGDALARLGYDPALSLAPSGAESAPPDWRNALSWEGGMLRVNRPATIDVGALGKGRLVDLVLDAVADRATGDITVDAGGDLAVRGRAQRIGLEHPFDPRRAIGVVELRDAALCASATNRRAWGDGLHHVLDARTGMPVRAYVATWAIAPAAMLADAVATALFFDGGPRLARERGVEWVRMRTDGRVEWSPDSTAELFS